jgi:hypothetical protein
MSMSVKITVKVTVKDTWAATDKLRLYRGTEGAESLAASSSVVRVTDKQIGNAAVGSKLTITFQYRASSVCATLPIGVSCVDAAGNESALLEDVKSIAASPQAPGRPSVASTGTPGEARLTWLASPDL